jgi:hypothetical protein
LHEAVDAYLVIGQCLLEARVSAAGATSRSVRGCGHRSSGSRVPGSYVLRIAAENEPAVRAAVASAASGNVCVCPTTTCTGTTFQCTYRRACSRPVRVTRWFQQEVRIGDLLGPHPGHGPDRGKVVRGEPLSRRHRSDFRSLGRCRRVDVVAARFADVGTSRAGHSGRRVRGVAASPRRCAGS